VHPIRRHEGTRIGRRRDHPIGDRNARDRPRVGPGSRRNRLDAPIGRDPIKTEIRSGEQRGRMLGVVTNTTPRASPTARRPARSSASAITTLSASPTSTERHLNSTGGGAAGSPAAAVAAATLASPNKTSAKATIALATPRRHRRATKCMAGRIEQDACPPHSIPASRARHRARSSNSPRSQSFRPTPSNRRQDREHAGHPNVTERTHPRTDQPVTYERPRSLLPNDPDPSNSSPPKPSRLSTPHNGIVYRFDTKAQIGAIQEEGLIRAQITRQF